MRKRLRDVPRYRERVAGAARREQPLSGALVPFSPQFFKQDQLKTDAVIAFAAKIGDWPLVEDAADAKIADQIEFVRWWDENVRRNQGARTDLNADLRLSYSKDEAERATGITQQQVSRWRKHLRDVPIYRERVAGTARQTRTQPLGRIT